VRLARQALVRGHAAGSWMTHRRIAFVEARGRQEAVGDDLEDVTGQCAPTSDGPAADS
jgi:hypothetical protein